MLAKYKFKDWVTTETQQLPVTDQMKDNRAEGIATALNDHQRWATHGRGIHMHTLRSELNLRIDDFWRDPTLKKLVWDYSWLLKDYMQRQQMINSFTAECFSSLSGDL